MAFGFVLLLLCMLCVLASLLVGLFAMVKGGEFNAKYGNKLMVSRVVFQGLALLILAILVAAGKH